ncbi:hypothetical protein [Nocardia sp. NPDC003726]
MPNTTAYVLVHEAWYTNPQRVQRPTLTVAVRDQDGAEEAEFEFEELPPGTLAPDSSLKLRVFDDAFGALAQLPEFLAALAAERPTTVAELVAILDRLGAEDITVRTRPGDAR